MTLSRPTHLLFALLLTVGCRDAEGPTPEIEAPAPPTGRLVIIGGALQAENAPVYHAVLEARDGDGPVCVIPTAGGDPLSSIASMVERITGYAGEGSALGIPISTDTPELAYDSATVAQIGSCSGFYFTGGSQTRVVDVFLPQGDTTPAYRAVWDRWQEGAVLAGSSAGAAMMARVMIAGGNPATAVTHGVAMGEDDEGMSITGGMGFFTRTHLDQHFLARGRIGRLLVATLATDSLQVGIGIDENTAIVVEGDSAVVIGASGVVLVDARGAARQGSLRGTGIRVNLAGAGDVVDLNTFQVRRDPAKTALAVGEASLTPPDDPLARWAFLGIVAGLASGPDSQATFQLEGATLTITEGEGFSAAATAETGGVQDAPLNFSAGPFLVDLVDSGL